MGRRAHETSIFAYWRAISRLKPELLARNSFPNSGSRSLPAFIVVSNRPRLLMTPTTPRSQVRFASVAPTRPDQVRALRVVAAVDEANRSRPRPHRQRMGQYPPRGVPDAPQQLAVGHPGGRKEDVLAGNQ